MSKQSIVKDHISNNLGMYIYKISNVENERNRNFKHLNQYNDKV